MSGSYTPPIGKQIAFDFQGGLYVPSTGNQVGFNFTTPVACSGYWVSRQGDQIPFKFPASGGWSSKQGDQIPWNFSCTGGTGSVANLAVTYSTGEVMSSGFTFTFLFSFNEGSELITALTPGYSSFGVTFDTGPGLTVVLTNEQHFYPNLFSYGSGWATANWLTTVPAIILAPNLFSYGTGFANGIPLALERWLSVNYWSDAGITAVLTIDPFTQFALPPNQEGSEMDLATISTAVLLPISYWNGPGVSIVVTSDPWTPFDWPVFGEGSETFSSLATQYAIPVSFWNGPGLTATVQTTALLPVNFWNGPGVTIQLTTFINTVTIPILDTGEEFTVDLHDQHQPAPNAYEGSEVTATLQTTALIQQQYWNGAGITIALTADPFTPFDWPQFTYSSGIAPLALSTQIHMPFFFWEGEQTDFTVSGAPVALMQPTFWASEEFVDQFLSTTAALFPSLFTYGTGVSITAIGNIPNIYAYEGAEAKANLGVQVSLYPNEIGAEAGLHLDIKTNPPQPLTLNQPAEGSSVNADLTVQYSAKISVLFRHSWSFEIGVPWVGTHLDLTRGDCCPSGIVDRAPYHIDLGDGLWDAPDWYYWSYRTVMQVDLFTRPRFQLNLFEGSTFASKPDINLGTVRCGEGSSFTPFIETIYKIRLCKGNFIPDPDSIIVELIYTYDDGCYSNVVNTGEHMSAALSVIQSAVAPAYGNEGLIASLSTDPKMTLNIWTGENGRVSNPEFSPRFPNGNQVNFRFEEPIWSAGEGAAVGSFVLNTKYLIRWAEFGCLDNEFIPVNGNGDAIPNPYGWQPVELELYEHHVKAVCFT